MPFLVAGRLLVTSSKGDFYQAAISSEPEDSQRLFCLALASNSLNPQISFQPQVFVYRGLYLHVFVTAAWRHCGKTRCAPVNHHQGRDEEVHTISGSSFLLVPSLHYSHHSSLHRWLSRSCGHFQCSWKKLEPGGAKSTEFDDSRLKSFSNQSFFESNPSPLKHNTGILPTLRWCKPRHGECTFLFLLLYFKGEGFCRVAV